LQKIPTESFVVRNTDPNFTPSEASSAAEEIGALQTEVATQRDRYLRLAADFESHRQ